MLSITGSTIMEKAMRLLDVHPTGSTAGSDSRRATQASGIRGRTFIVLALVGLAALAVLLASSPARGEIIAGTFRYQDTSQLRPIAFCRVEIWSFRPRGLGIWTWAAEKNVTTDTNGSIWEPMGPTQNGVLYGLRIFATNYAAKVWPNDAVHTVEFHREPGEPGPVVNLRVNNPNADVLDFSFDFTDSFAPQHYNIAETVRHGFDYVAARRDPLESDPLPQANVQPTSVGGSWYNPTVDTVVITTGRVFDDFLILHEYAHFVEEQISSFAWIASVHDGCYARDGLGTVINSAEHAWMEAFAEFFAMAVATTAPPGSLNGTFEQTFSPSRLENPGTCDALGDFGSNGLIRADMIEEKVAAILWDLFDGTAESFDTLGGFDDEIIQILDRELDTVKWPTISDFRAAWNARGLPEQGLDKILKNQSMALEGMTYPDIAVTRIAASGSSVHAGSSIAIEDTTANQGTAPTEAATITRFSISTDGTVDLSDRILGTRSIGDLCPGCASSGSTTITIPSNLVPGKYFIGACADATGLVVESNEAANCSGGILIEVLAPPVPSTCFADDFSGRATRPHWTVVSGTWDDSNKNLLGTPEIKGEAWIWAGSPPASLEKGSSYSFDFALTETSGKGGRSGGVMFCADRATYRKDPQMRGYTLEWSDGIDVGARGLLLKRWDGTGSSVSLNEGTPDLKDPPARLEIVLEGKTILCSGNGELLIEVSDGLYRGGYFGAFSANATGILLDNVVAGTGCSPAGSLQVPGDCNQDRALDISDAVCILGNLFLGNPARLPCGDGTPSHAANRTLLDHNADQRLDISDAVGLLSFLFSGGKPNPLGSVPVRIEGCP